MVPTAETKAWACAKTPGSLWACSLRTDCKISRKWGFSVKESGVGGRDVVVPIAKRGTSVGRRDRECEEPFGNTYWSVS